MKKVLALFAVSALFLVSCTGRRTMVYQSPASIIISPNVRNVDETTCVQASAEVASDRYFPITVAGGSALRALEN